LERSDASELWQKIDPSFRIIVLNGVRARYIASFGKAVKTNSSVTTSLFEQEFKILEKVFLNEILSGSEQGGKFLIHYFCASHDLKIKYDFHTSMQSYYLWCKKIGLQEAQETNLK